MKQKIIIGLAIFIVSLIAQGVFAAELDSTLSFEILSENIEAYSLNFGNQDIIVGNILTKQLIFLNNQNNSGFFYLRNNNIRSFPQQFTFISPRINEIKYNLIHFESLSEFLTNEQLTAFGVEEQGFFSLVSELDSKSITINGTKIDALLLPDDGSKLITASNGNFGSKELPVNLKFKERNSSSENLQDVAGGEAEVQSGEIGCIDNDDVSSLTNLDLEENSPSFVSYIFKKNGELTSITIPDFCAESIIEQGRTLSKLYEAECSADGLPTYREVNCNCNNGACITENKIQRYCIDTDPLTYDVEEEEEEAIENEGIENRASGQIDIDKGSGKTPAEGFTITFGSKGTTMGYYAATEGKEFGLWEDYCADEKTLVEYYCTNDETTMFRTVICPKGCSNGKCIELPYCFETDGGKTIEYKGITKAVNSSESYHNLVDECVDRNTLKEYYCDKTSVLTGFNSENIACGEGKECNDGKCTNIETCITDDDCTDGQTCIGGVCAHGYVTACFIDQECPQGYECTGEPGNIGQCVPIEEVELLKCSSCITERPYDVWVWEGETCAIDETKYEEEILSCQKGSYCVENDMLGPQCSVESLDTWEQIYGAFLRIQIWAKWLNTLIPPSIGVAQDDSSEGRVWQAGMNSVSQGLNSIDNAISAAAAQSSDESEGGITFCNSNEDCGPNGICREVDTEPGIPCPNNMCGICVARTEAEPTPTQKIGDTCLNDGECIDGICQNQLCRCSHEGESVGCQSSDTYCASIGSQCVDKKEGLGYCSHNYECLNNLCTENGCSIYCGSSADCASNKRCNIERDLPAGTCPNNMDPCGFCVLRPEIPKKLGGAICSNNDECSSSSCQNGKCTCNAAGSANCGTGKYCATAGQACVNKKFESQTCTANYECLNNQCVSGQCKPEYDVDDGYNVN